MDSRSTSERTSTFAHNEGKVSLTMCRNLPHSADPDEIDHLESYLNQQIPALGDVKFEP
jgi:hypothetical protein